MVSDRDPSPKHWHVIYEVEAGHYIRLPYKYKQAINAHRVAKKMVAREQAREAYIRQCFDCDGKD